MSTKKIRFQGRSQTVAEWAEELGITRVTLRNRLSRLSVREAMSRRPKRKKRGGTVKRTKNGRLMLTHGGRTLQLSEWAKELGVTANGLSGRLRRGFTVAEVLDPDFRKGGYHMRETRRDGLTYKGRHQTLTDWAAEVGLPVATLLTRLREGWSVKDALTRKRPATYGKITHNGETLTPIQWAKKLGLSRQEIYRRLAAVSIEEALIPKDPNYRRGRRPKMYTHKGRSLSLADWAEECGVATSTLRSRMRRHSFAKALKM